VQLYLACTVSYLTIVMLIFPLIFILLPVFRRKKTRHFRNVMSKSVSAYFSYSVHGLKNLTYGVPTKCKFDVRTLHIFIQLFKQNKAPFRLKLIA